MTNFNQRLNRILTVASALAMIAMMLHVVAHALLRSFLGSPIYGTNEMVTYWYLPIVALLGIPAAQLQKQHISVTLITDRFGSRTEGLFNAFACVLGAIVALGFAWFGLGEAIDNMRTQSTAGVTNITTWPVYFVVPFAFSLLAYIYLTHALSASTKGPPTSDQPVGDRIELEDEKSSG